MAARSYCLVRDVHDRLHRPHECLDGAAADERRSAHGSAASGRRARNLLLGIPVAADAGWTSGPALERETRDRDFAGRLGILLDGNRFGSHRATVLGNAIGTRTRRRWSLAGGSGVGCALVSARGTRSRQRLLDALFTSLRRHLVAFVRLVVGSLELASAPDRGGSSAILVATHLAVDHRRPSAHREVDLAARARLS